MSGAARRRLFRPLRHVCRSCHEQRAQFRYRGQVRADRDHDMRFRCFRAEIVRQRDAALRQHAATMETYGPQH